LEQLSVKFLKTTNNYLYKNKIEINSIEILKQKTINSDKILVKALSPVEAHTTNYDNDTKSTYYHSPFEAKFSDLINENINLEEEVKKYLDEEDED
jgi:CRISPR-associated endoribonuclease Cas6